MNLSGVVDWSTEWPLVDVFKASRSWVKNDWQSATDDPSYRFDVQGNPLLKPGQAVQTLMLREIGGHYPAGVYVITYRGAGKLTLGNGDPLQIVRQGPGRIEVRVKPGNGGLILQIPESDPRDPIRAIKVWMPGFQNAPSPFHPLFLERLRPFGAVRFMDWQNTNNSPVRHWSERAKPTDARWATAKGMPPEILLDLANTLGVDPWFCMPHTADDEFVTQFALLVKQRLKPNLKVYIEYSNEVWNSQFGQARHALEQGRLKKLGPSDFESQLRWYSERSVAVFRLWEAVFSSVSRARLVRVMASQSANPWVSEQVLGWKNAAQQVDALAIAPYFGNEFGTPQTQNKVATMTVDQLLNALEQEIDGKNREWIEQNVAVARKFKVPRLVAYEGGQHLVGVGGAENNPMLTDLFFAANRSPRMYDLYRKHLSNWFRAGGDLYMAFSSVAKPSKWGSWGALEYQDQPTANAPKYRRLIDTLRQKPIARNG